MRRDTHSSSKKLRRSKKLRVVGTADDADGDAGLALPEIEAACLDDARTVRVAPDNLVHLAPHVVRSDRAPQRKLGLGVESSKLGSDQNLDHARATDVAKDPKHAVSLLQGPIFGKYQGTDYAALRGDGKMYIAWVSYAAYKFYLKPLGLKRNPHDGSVHGRVKTKDPFPTREELRAAWIAFGDAFYHRGC